ncbi:MAG: bifunctional 4-hydroxy-2-oxoglutarate aldolase/2-dehydro-3-deoxy-phosphogluconate aldolase [Gemmiger sp.]|uniref:bifunctional 4-hydroxy-2-oxoglutarate aldolase/2-dehydro-3-deoxy-phosphogluconate aldolase n=1 Tax=Gemmiger sp. TaxID=2049027 RepID=UPI002E78A84B|nr:bifunctional 4-hydroxy-2-oxoglutarate aldolase/2-dehydro-3-deoxy-phosphogluconate aldolase [Gemmiger sp.]MEE0799859.1 bifunctional 4-hydroxy-2-oxoglutarate aldolase/2-dehydro-3-deoxy-phosphogluconate aldolase [Gemmiger sp.]
MVTDRFEELGVVPVVVLNNADDALPLARALVRGGLPCAEVTFRTDAAEESIRRMHEAYPEMVIAAGTVLTTENVDRAVAAGASIIVSPGFDPEIVDYCLSKGIEVCPGIMTPSEMAQGVKRGLTRLKFFPAEAGGGVPMIQAMCAAYTSVRIMPTGGINQKNLAQYLSCDKIFCCGGSWMVKDALIREGRFDRIEEMTREAVTLVRQIRQG